MPTVEVLASGANISGANGIHFGPDGLLYVTSVVGSDITLIDPETGNVAKRLSTADGVIGPDDVAFASDGAYYWTSILTGEVAGFDAEGRLVVAASCRRDRIRSRSRTTTGSSLRNASSVTTFTNSILPGSKHLV